MRPQRHQLADPAPGLAALPAPDRLRVLTAVTEVFATQGYGATTAEQLQLQIYPRIFEALFADEEDCFLQTFDHHVAAAREQIAAAALTGDNWHLRLGSGFRTLLELIDANPAAARLVLIEAQVSTPTISRRFFETVQLAVPFMREGRSPAEERTPTVVDSVLPGGVAATLANHVSSEPRQPVTELYDQLLETLLIYRPGPEVADFLATEALREAV